MNGRSNNGSLKWWQWLAREVLVKEGFLALLVLLLIAFVLTSQFWLLSEIRDASHDRLEIQRKQAEIDSRFLEFLQNTYSENRGER